MSLGGDEGDAPSHPGIELDVSPVPLGSKGAHDPCVEWSVTTVNRRAEGTTRPRKTYKNLGRETGLFTYAYTSYFTNTAWKRTGSCGTTEKWSELTQE